MKKCNLKCVLLEEVLTDMKQWSKIRTEQFQLEGAAVTIWASCWSPQAWATGTPNYWQLSPDRWHGTFFWSCWYPSAFLCLLALLLGAMERLVCSDVFWLELQISCFWILPANYLMIWHCWYFPSDSSQHCCSGPMQAVPAQGRGVGRRYLKSFPTQIILCF